MENLHKKNTLAPTAKDQISQLKINENGNGEFLMHQTRKIYYLFLCEIHQQ